MKKSTGSGWVVVTTAPTLVDADMTVAWLTSNGIKAEVVDAMSLGVACLAALPSGFRVAVPYSDLQAAKQVLAAQSNSGKP